ncbi:choline dehydrogenase [Pseudoalteromonas translucida KMM 520]|uniref:Choline dehydrogenase n=1 Tax=Pseudoalteromonas translucida KMM 520 TaxID=1315283 RepID=A0A0U2WK59_9GAMM|nr:GMC family oxidoreductase N-terminal domain-containing protein [Pseudoalteromonas translucida]ALS32283.1 choline dehydrogenase [Pseudoalteromonas translucida KMM 520]
MKTQYDVIVVGAGSAGCTLAYRIARESSLQVLLLEAGSTDNSPMIHIPMGFAFLLKPHKNNWAFKTCPERFLNNRIVDLPRGKVLGGCSSINGMVYIRGQKQDFDRWAQQGNTGWSYSDVLPYFIRSEHNESGANNYHGENGPLWVSVVDDEFPIHQAFSAAAIEAGHSFNFDVNGESQAGISWFPRTIKNGRRFSSARAFLGAGSTLTNLTVITHARVKQLIFNDNRVVQIKTQIKNKDVVFRVNHETIISAGAINSPLLLERSGIGQKERLEALGIKVKLDLQGVGENLQDHWNTYIKQRVKNTKTYFSEAKGIGLIKNLIRYAFTRKGFLGDSAATMAVFYKTSDKLKTPDAQIHFAPAASKINARGNMQPINAITVASCLIRPTSRGSVHLSSVDEKQAPQIQLNYLASQSDQKLSLIAFRKARHILKQTSLAAMLDGEAEPGEKLQSDDSLLEYIKNTGEPVHHLAGSCKMGSDPMAVVDERLMVHGINNLRVADASIMPDLISGNTHATCVMIGEKCADFVIRSYSDKATL